MNPGKRSETASSVSMHNRLREWRQLLDRCERKPARKRVHALRVVTLRLQAEVQIDLAEIPRASHQAQSILEFIKHGEKLRKILGAVRELDVWIGKLDRLRVSLSQSGKYVPRSTLECIRQMEQFEGRLKKKRRPLEKKLMTAIKKRKVDFTAAADAVVAATDGRITDNSPSGANASRTQFAQVAKDFPAFSEENLHEFRKRIKMVRYLAESCQSDPACAQIASQMRRLQSAIGEWHDWQALARELHRGRGGTSKDAEELLRTIAAESLESALATCRSITDKLLAEPAGNDRSRKGPARIHPHALLEPVQRSA